MIARRTCKLHRSANGMVFGVFQGLADWMGINVWVVRVIAFIVMCHIGLGWSIALYLIGALTMPRP